MNINEIRPTFFRYADSRAFSGWTSHNGDLWSDEETQQAVVALLRESPNLKGLAVEIAFGMQNEHGLYLMKHAEPALQTGERLEFEADVDMHPLDYVEAGERCVAVRRDRCSGSVELFMQNYHKRLDEDSNCLVLEPHNCDELLAVLRVMRRAPVHTQRETVAA